MVYLDLEELPSLVGRNQLIASSKSASRSFLRSDHLFDNDQPLETELAQITREQTGKATAGPIRMLTQLRWCGYYFSPLNLFFVFDARDQAVEFVVAEVNNTPWNERHCYVLWEGNRTGKTDALRFSHPKEFHVSPFMSMAMQYRWALSEPASTLRLRLVNLHQSRQWFSASMSLKRRALNQQQLRLMSFRYPLMSAKITAAIYLQACKLWWKQCPFYTHPEKQNPPRFPAPSLTEQIPSQTGVVR